MAYVHRKYARWGGGGYALWFIPVLALAEVLNYILGWYCSSCVRSLFLLFCAGLSYTAYICDLTPYWNIFFVPAAAFFYGFGSQLKKWLFLIDKKMDTKSVCGFAFIMFLVSLLCLCLPTKPEWFINKLSTPLVYPLSIIGSLSVFFGFIAYSRSQSKIFVWFGNLLTYVGRNTFVILAFHQVTLQLISASGIKSGMLVRLLMWLIMVLLIELINRYFPSLLGKS